MRKNWAEQWVARVQRRPLLVLVSYLAVVLGAVTVLVGGTIASVRWFDQSVFWRDDHYATLVELKAGFDIQKFREVLGSPVFERTSDRGKFVESSFQGRGYWVQTVSDGDGTVLRYAVTACDESFSPTFSPAHLATPIVLNKSSMASVKTRDDEGDIDVYASYFASGATENSYFIDWNYGGNPSNYKTFAWGLNDACPSWQRVSEALEREELLPFRPNERFNSGYTGLVSEAPSTVPRFRESAVLNTYSETAPNVDFKEILKAFQVGVDRILIRTVYE